jgi:glycosyltransferase involved in cell wall biosynthesis
MKYQNILISVEDLKAGGAQTFVLRFAQYCSLKGHTVFIFCHYSWMIDLVMVKKMAPSVIVLSFNQLPHWIDYLFFRFENFLQKFKLINFHPRKIFLANFLRKLIIKNKVSCVFSNTIKSDYVCANALKDLKIPFLITMHGDYEGFTEFSRLGDKRRIPFLHNFMKRIYKRLNFLVYLSENNLNTFRIFGSKTTITKKIYNGFTGTFSQNLNEKLRTKYNIPESAIVFCMVARGVEGKGWAELIEAFEKLKNDNVYLILIGDGEFLSKLSDVNINRRIIFTGKHSNPLDIIRSCDIGILPSKMRESLPNSIIEYLFCGLPVISTNIGEVSKMLSGTDGISGILISHPDENYIKYKEEMFLALKGMLDSEVRNQYKKHSYSAYKKFDMELCYQNYLSLLN